MVLDFKDAKLDFGCGSNKEPGYIGVDLRELPGVDIVLSSVRDRTDMPSGCASIIRSCHFIEHLSHNEVLDLFDNWFRILKNGGILLTFFPDLSKIVPEVNIEVALKHIFGGRDYPENYHLSFWCKDSVMRALHEVGFMGLEEIEYKGPHHPYKPPMAWTTGIEARKC